MGVANAGGSTLTGRVDEITRNHALLQPGRLRPAPASSGRGRTGHSQNPVAGRDHSARDRSGRLQRVQGGRPHRTGPFRSDVELWPVVQLG